jgi:hypothetical protein
MHNPEVALVQARWAFGMLSWSISNLFPMSSGTLLFQLYHKKVFIRFHWSVKWKLNYKKMPYMFAQLHLSRKITSSAHRIFTKARRTWDTKTHFSNCIKEMPLCILKMLSWSRLIVCETRYRKVPR